MVRFRATFIVIGVLVGALLLPLGRVVADTSNRGPAPEKIMRYVREKFGIPDTVSMTAEPFHSAPFPGYLETTITVTRGDKKSTQDVSVSANGHYLVLSDFIPLGKDPRAGIVQHLRESSKLPDNIQIHVGPFVSSPYPSFDSTIVSAVVSGKDQKGRVYVTKDKRFLVMGQIFNMQEDPRSEALRTLNLKDQASEGPANAPVTIVEFADLECPSCGQAHLFIKNDLLPRYGKKLHLVFKEFPLVQIHTWALEGAIADQCAYQINPSLFPAYRASIFEHQQDINATNVRDMLLYFGQRVGLDRLKLSGCIDSKATLPRVEASMREGQELGVDSTPTFFINGRKLVWAGPQAFEEAVQKALQAAR